MHTYIHACIHAYIHACRIPRKAAAGTTPTRALELTRSGLGAARTLAADDQILQSRGAGRIRGAFAFFFNKMACLCYFVRRPPSHQIGLFVKTLMDLKKVSRAGRSSSGARCALAHEKELFKIQKFKAINKTSRKTRLLPDGFRFRSTCGSLHITSEVRGAETPRTARRDDTPRRIGASFVTSPWMMTRPRPACEARL